MNIVYVSANRLERFTAFIVDLFVIAFTNNIVMQAFIIDGKEGEIALHPISELAFFLMLAAYYVGFTSSKWQATPGKRIMNMHVIKTNGRKLSQANALERFIVFMFPFLPMFAQSLSPLIATLGFIWLLLFWFTPILMDPQRAGLHDKICHTRVVTGQPI